MNELIDERTLLIVGCTALVLACLLGIVTAVIRAKRKKAERRKLVSLLEVSRDWQPTWRVNAVGDAWLMEHEKDNIPANFVLRIEEDRLLRDIGGGEIKEIRWRQPTRAEMREIVRRYHLVEGQEKKPPDVIEFEKHLHSGASNGSLAARVGELRPRVDRAAATLVPGPAPDQEVSRQKQTASIAGSGTT
jgi:hypothetical protein